MLHPGQHTFWI